MRKLSILGLILSLSLAGTALASIHPVRSLNDLPSHWHGVAGNLFTKTPATFTIDRIIKVTHQNHDGELSATYDVAAKFHFLGRTLNVKRILLRKFETNSDVYDLVLVTDDVLVKYVETSVAYDEATDSFTMRDLVRNGQRRFVLSGQAPAQK